MRKARLSFALLFTLILQVGPGRGQQIEPDTAVGMPQTEFNGTAIEHVDLMSGALQVTIPLLHMPGRGVDSDIALSYTSKVWSTQTAEFDVFGDGSVISTAYFDVPSTKPTLGFGYSDVLWGEISSNWFLNFKGIGSVAGVQFQNFDGGGSSYYQLHTATIQDFDGSTSVFTQSNGFYYDTYAACDPFSGTCVFTCLGTNNCLDGPYWSYDNTFQTLYTYDTGFTLYKKNGFIQTLMSPNAPDLDGSIYTLQDTNGNQITCSLGICTDTVGRKFTLSVDSNGQVGGLQYTDSSGSEQNINIFYIPYALEYPYFIGPAEQICYLGGQITDGCVYSPSIQAFLPREIQLPGGATYQFEFTSSTGELTKITFPSGGYTRYEYGPGPLEPNIPFCYLGEMTPALCQSRGENRVVTDRYVSPDGTAQSEQHWSYQIRQPATLTTGPSAGAPVVKSTVTKPNGESEVDYFQDGDLLGANTLSVIPQLLEKQELSNAGNIIRTTDYTAGYDNSEYVVYDNFAHGPQYGFSNPRPTSSTITLNDSGMSALTSWQYSQYGNISQESSYDWSSGSVGGLIKRSAYTYLTDVVSAYAANNVHILDRLQSYSIYDSFQNQCQGAAVPCSQVNFSYDEYPVAPMSNIVSHITELSLRGNVTSISKWLSGVQPIFSHKQYDDTGNLIMDQDGNGDQTTYAYTDAFVGSAGAQSGLANVYPTTITLPMTTGGVSHVLHYQWYYNSGLVAASCGENYPVAAECTAGQVGSNVPDYRSFTYEAQNRLHCANSGDGGSTCFQYVDSGSPLSVTKTTIGGTLSAPVYYTSKSLFDGLGRTSQTMDAAGAIVNTTYDTLGRVASVSNPHFTAPSASDGVTSFLYDALGRKTRQCQPDNIPSNSTVCVPNNAFLSWSYNGNATTSTDEVRKSWMRTTDARGRIVQMTEPGLLNTYYTYDALDNLQTVTQAGANSETPRVRSFTYDAMSRLTCAANPENSSGSCPASPSTSVPAGVTSYSYDANGNVQTKTDSRGITTSYVYDPLNRLMGKGYSSNDTAKTPWACYGYDTATNGVGRLASSWTVPAGTSVLNTCNGVFPSAGTLSYRKIISYSPVGQVLSEQQCTPGNCTAVANSPYALNYAYDLVGHVIHAEGGLGQAAWVPQYTDATGRLTGVSAVTTWDPTLFPAQLLSVQSYSPGGGIKNWTLGIPASGTPALTGVRQYDQRFRPSTETVSGHD